MLSFVFPESVKSITYLSSFARAVTELRLRQYVASKAITRSVTFKTRNTSRHHEICKVYSNSTSLTNGLELFALTNTSRIIALYIVDASNIKYTTFQCCFTGNKRSDCWKPIGKLGMKQTELPANLFGEDKAEDCYEFTSKSESVFGRLYIFSPRVNERNNLQTLLLHVSGAT